MVLEDALKRNTTLTTLCLSDSGVAAVELVSAVLKVNTSLKSLYLGNNSIRNKDAAALGAVLKVNTSLTRLYLWGNLIRDEGVALILSILTEWNATLTVLDLFNCSVSLSLQSAITDIVNANASGIRLLHAEGKHDLSSKGIGVREAKQLGKELGENIALTTLVLNKNNIGHLGSVDIAEALIKNRTLTSIELDDNSIGDAGSAAVAASIQENNVLTKLSLNGNSIGLTGVTAFAMALQRNTSIRELGLGRNSIGNDSAVAIANALRRNDTVARLDLDGNSISDNGAMSLLNVLKDYNCTLTQLNLQENTEISPVLVDTIKGMLDSRLIFNFLLKCLRRPLEKGAVPLVVQMVHRGLIFCMQQELTHCHQAAGTAGFVFHLVRATALNDSKVIKARSNKRVGSFSNDHITL
jgi:NLR family CARD domain-containing protein 3